MSLKIQNTSMSSSKKNMRDKYRTSVKKPVLLSHSVSSPSVSSLKKKMKIKKKMTKGSKKKKHNASHLLKSNFHKVNELIEFNCKTLVFTNIKTIIFSGMNETNFHLLSNISIAVEKLNSTRGRVTLKDIYDKNSQFLFYYTCSILYNNRYLDVFCAICGVDRKMVEMKIEDFLGIKKMQKTMKGGGAKLRQAVNFIWCIMNIILIVSYSYYFSESTKKITNIYESSETKQILSPLVQQMEKSLHDPSYLKKCIIKKRIDQTKTNIEYAALKLLLEPFGVPFSNMINDFTSFQQCVYNDFSIINQDDMSFITKVKSSRPVRHSIAMGDEKMLNLDEDNFYSNPNQMTNVVATDRTAITSYDNFATNMGDFSGKMLSVDFKNSIDSIFDNEGTDFDKLTKIENFITKYIQYGDDFETALIDIFGANYQDVFDDEFCNSSKPKDYKGTAFCAIKRSTVVSSYIIQGYNSYNTGQFQALWVNIRVYFNELKARFQHYKIHFNKTQSNIFIELKYFKDEISRLISLMYCVCWASLSVASYIAANLYWYMTQKQKTLPSVVASSPSRAVGSDKTISLKSPTFDLDKLIEDDLVKRFSQIKMDDIPSINSID